jgi:hypothetical protein
MPYTPSSIGGVAADRFGVKKNTGWLWIASAGLTDTTNFVPTEVEINNTTNARDLTCAVAGFTGFTGSPRYAELADLCADVDGKVPDGVSLDDSSLSFYLARDGDDALGFFDEEDLGYIYHAPYGRFDDGSAAETRAYAWKAEVSFVTPTPAMAGGAMGVVSYGILDRREVTLPAATT